MIRNVFHTKQWSILILFLPLFLCAQIDTTLFAQRFKIDKNNPSDTVTWIKNRRLALEGKLKKYDRFFTLLNGDTQTVKFKDVKDADEIVFDPASEKYYKVRNKRQLSAGAHVLGWHPYWMKEELKTYPYEYLTDIIFFAYDIDPLTGSYSDRDAINEWLTTPLCDSANKYQNNILLCVTSYGKEANIQFLQNEELRIAFCDTIRFLLNARKGHGVDLDFTGLTEDLADEFTKLIVSLREKLGDSSLIYVHLPANAASRKFMENPEFTRKARPLINLFIMNAYDYENTNGTAPLPMAPSSRYNQKIGLNEIYAWCKKNKIDSTRLILNLPLYGTLWEFNEKKWSPREIAYEDIVAGYAKTESQYFDVKTGSTFIPLKTSVIWYESGESLKSKFAWAKEKGFNGVGLWGLGYAGTNTDVWEAILRSFDVPRYIAVEPISVDNGSMYNLFYAINKHRKVLGYSLLIIVFMIVVATLLSLLDWRIREIFFRNYIYRAVLTALMILLLIVGINWISIGSSGIAVFFYGLLTGGGLMYLVSRFYLLYRKKMP